MTGRERALSFGAVADSYDEVRPGYPPELVDAVLAYAGRVPATVVEVGAGTGKATEGFAGRGLPVLCLEPDPLMARVLRRRFADRPGVSVVPATFEEWRSPAGGVDLLYSAQAWHWTDPATRWRRAYDALAPGGTLALFGHGYLFAEPELAAAVREVYRARAPEALEQDPLQPPATVRAPRAEDVWLGAELRGAEIFADVRVLDFDRVEPYPTARYLALVSTFSSHRVLAEERRADLLAGLAGAIDAHGGVVGVRLATVLAMGRRP
jgi:SAM-dependent methyltransferase